MTSYLFILKDNTRKAFNQFSWFLFFLHIVIASVIIIKSQDVHCRNYSIGSCIFWLMLYVAYAVFKNAFQLFYYQVVMMITIVVFWILQNAWIPAAASALIILFSIWLLQKKSSVSFSREQVVLKKSILTKIFLWKELDNAVLKDGLLTIDTRTNHLLQLELDAENKEVNENEFNAFCSSLLQPQ